MVHIIGGTEKKKNSCKLDIIELPITILNQNKVKFLSKWN